MAGAETELIGLDGALFDGCQSKERENQLHLLPLRSPSSTDSSARLRAGAHFLTIGESVSLENDQGYMTSVAFSPMLKHWIGLGLLVRGRDRLGERIRVYDPLRNSDFSAEVCSPVFSIRMGSIFVVRENLSSCSPFQSLTPVAVGAGVSVTDRDGIGIVALEARRGSGNDLAAAVKNFYAIELPRKPSRVSQGDFAIGATGPNTWLATSDAGYDGFANSLRIAFGSTAAVVDQSAGLSVLCLSGPRIRDALAKGVSIDLHESEFKIGDVAVTSISHIGTTVWRIEDGPD